MSAGSYDRNSRVSTSGKYSGPYIVGLRMTKTWSGANYPAGKPLRTNVFTPGEIRYRTRVVFDKVIRWRRGYEFRYVKSPKGVWAKVFTQYSRPYRERIPREITESYLTRPRKVYSRAPKRARIAEHNYTCNWTNDNTAVVNYTYSGVGNFSQASSSIVNSFTVSSGFTSNDDLVLFGKLRERVAGSDFNAGIAAAEYGKTLDLIANAAIRIRKGLNALRAGNIPEAIIQLADHSSARRRPRGSHPSKDKSVQRNWLELQYGWLPLLNDCDTGARFLAHQLNSPIQQTVRVSRQKLNTVAWSGSSGWKYQKSTCFTRKSIKAIIREKDPAQLSGLTDPATIAWELVPYSFVVDWFIPIGNYLSARGLSQALTGTFVVTTVDKEDHDGFIQFGAPITGVSMSGNPFLERGSMTRTVDSVLQIPLPSWKPLAQVASWRHCANAIALLSSRKWRDD